MNNKRRKSLNNRKNNLKQILIYFIVSIVIFSVLFAIKNNFFSENVKINITIEIFINIFSMLASALISAVITIYKVKNDILENDLIDKVDMFGLITIEESYDSVFSNDDGRILLQSDDWIDFFKSSNNGYICISGLTLIRFLSSESLRYCLYELCLTNNYKIDIILANPNSNEILLESCAENRLNNYDIRNDIISTYRTLVRDMNQLQSEYEKLGENFCFYDKIKDSPENIFAKNFRIVFSFIMPKALLIQSGKKMVVSPYLLSKNNTSQPTMIVKDTDSNSYFKAYKNYINRLIECGCSFEELVIGSKNKIIENNHGVLQIISGRNNIFTKDNLISTKADSWASLFEKATNIDIVGISMYGFFFPDRLEQKLVKFASKGTNIKIIWANPYSQELQFQSAAENKNGKIKDHICLLHDVFNENIADLTEDEQNNCKKHLKLLYSATLPRAFIAKVDNIMFYSPYFLSGPYEEPVFVISKCDGKTNYLYDRIENYINELTKTSKSFSELSP